MILDANGSLLRPQLLLHAWTRIPRHLRGGAYLLLAPCQLEYFLEHYPIRFGLDGVSIRPMGIDACFQANPWIQADAVFVMSIDVRQLAQIKNLAVPQRKAA